MRQRIFPHAEFVRKRFCIGVNSKSRILSCEVVVQCSIAPGMPRLGRRAMLWVLLIAVPAGRFCSLRMGLGNAFSGVLPLQNGRV